MSNLESGRINQKLRTRNALVAVAIQLLRQGKVFSVTQVADLARVGRATAFRYFPTQTHLLSQALLESIGDPDEAQLALFFKTCTDTGKRVEAVIAASDDSTRAREQEYRAMLRLSLESESPSVPRRGKYRVKFFERALSGVRRKLGKKRYEMLNAALGLCTGIESSVVLSDIYRLPPGAAREVKIWAARALLEQAFREMNEDKAAPVPRKRPVRRTQARSL